MRRSRERTSSPAIAAADATIEALDLDSPGVVPWWGNQPVTLYRVLVHVTTETCRHAGHADLARELVDGKAGYATWDSNVPEHDGRVGGAPTGTVSKTRRAGPADAGDYFHGAYVMYRPLSRRQEKYPSIWLLSSYFARGWNCAPDWFFCRHRRSWALAGAWGAGDIA